MFFEWIQDRLSSVQFSHSVVSDSLQPHGPQHARPPCPPPTPRACSNSCPSSQWCHPTISSFVVPFSFYLQSFPASESFPMSQFFASGGQSIRASASVQKLVFIQKSSPVTQLVKILPNDTGDRGDMGSIPGLGRFPREGNGNPLQYSCLENSMDREAWWATVHRVAKSWTWLSNWPLILSLRKITKTMQMLC